MKYSKLFGRKTSFAVLKCYLRCFSKDTSTVRVRFAPSPTGFLHIGGLRTALYNYLFAKSKGGSFVLRIEDTDQSRFVAGAVEKLEDDLKWAGLNPDEGPSIGGAYGPYLQSQRLELYKKEVDRLLSTKNAYYCFCSDHRLDLMRRDSLRRRQIPKYDNNCRNLSDEEVNEKLESNSTYCVRFKLSSTVPKWDDVIYGSVTPNLESEGDFVIMKKDKYPTYHLANVVDDHYMKITHVLRGVEWQISTVKHLLLYKAFDWDPPAYAHLPLLLNTDGTKLSKRHNNSTVESYRNQGVFPRALFNCLITSGGGFHKPTDKNQLKSLETLTSEFSLDLLKVNNCQVAFERVDEFNKIELKRLLSDESSLKELSDQTRCVVHNYLKQNNMTPLNLDDNRIRDILVKTADRISKISDLVGKDFVFLWSEPSEETALKNDPEFFEIIPSLVEKIQELETYDDSLTPTFFKEYAAENELNYPKFMKFLRSCLSGLKDGPGVSEIALMLGKENTIKRLSSAYSCSKSSQRVKMT